MVNQEIRMAAKENGVRLWEIADELGMNDGNLSRKLRHELPADEREQIISIITGIAERKREGMKCCQE